LDYDNRGKSVYTPLCVRDQEMPLPPQAVHLMAGLKHPVTPDGRYFVVRGRLWRLANPGLSSAARLALVSELMEARRAVRSAKLSGDHAAQAAAHHAIDVAKRKLGERGPVWWADGSPDLNRHMVKNTSYAAWYADLKTAGRREQRSKSPPLGGVQTS
jgi:hypothetical protein